MYVFGCINWSSIFVVNSHGYLQLYVVSSISFIVLISRFFITVKRHHHYGNSRELKKKSNRGGLLTVSEVRSIVIRMRNMAACRKMWCWS